MQMQKIVDLAGQLGQAISESPQAAALKAARGELTAQPELTQAMGDYQTQAEKMRALEAENKPIEVDDKHILEQLHAKLVASDVFKTFTEAQMEYVDLMRKVNEAMQSGLGDIE